MTSDYVVLSPDVRYRLFVEEDHVGQIGPEAESIDDRPMHYSGVIVEHRTADPDFDGRPGHPSPDPGWCPGGVEWCSRGAAPRWTLVALDPLTLEPSVQCRTHPNEFHIFIRAGKVA